MEERFIMKKISYGGWDNCYQIANGSMELVVTGDVGPRVIRLGVPGKQNLFKEFKEMMGLTGGDEWRIYGGHRLWHAPEAKPRSYIPDNSPVKVTATKDGLRVVQDTEPATGIQKQIDIALHKSKPYARVTHRLTNRNLWDVKLAPWGLSVMAQGGTAIIPQAPYGSHEENLPPSRPLVLADIATDESAVSLLERLQSVGVLGIPFGPQQIRFVTHLDVTPADIDYALGQIQRLT